jgi:hypothetical protein
LECEGESLQADFFEVGIWRQGFDTSLNFTYAWASGGEGENELVIVLG